MFPGRTDFLEEKGPNLQMISMVVALNDMTEVNEKVKSLIKFLSSHDLSLSLSLLSCWAAKEGDTDPRFSFWLSASFKSLS